MSEGPVATKLTKRAKKASDEKLHQVIASEEDDSVKLIVLRPSSMNSVWRNLIWNLFEGNMKTMLENSSFGWDPEVKYEEIFHEEARFIVWSDKSQSKPTVSAFACFRFEGDPDLQGKIRNVIYWFLAMSFKSHLSTGDRAWAVICLMPYIK